MTSLRYSPAAIGEVMGMFIKSYSLSCRLKCEKESEIVALVLTDTEQISEGE